MTGKHDDEPHKAKHEDEPKHTAAAPAVLPAGGLTFAQVKEALTRMKLSITGPIEMADGVEFNIVTPTGQLVGVKLNVDDIASARSLDDRLLQLRATYFGH